MVKNTPANAGDSGDTGLIPRSGRSPGEGNGNPFQYSCLGNPMDRGAWWATVHGGCKRLNNNNKGSHPENISGESLEGPGIRQVAQAALLSS